MNLWASFSRIPSGRVSKYFVVVFWIAVMLWAASAGGRLVDVENNNATSFLPDSAQSTQALEIIRDRPGGASTPADVVIVRESGITQSDRDLADRFAKDLRQARLSAGSSSQIGQPVESKDGKALLVTDPLNFVSGDELSADLVRTYEITGTSVPGQLDESGHRTSDGAQIWVAGPAAISGALQQVSGDIDGTLLLVSGLVVIVMLLLTYRSPTLWAFPLVSVGVGLTLARAMNYLMADAGLYVVNFMSASILLVLVFGAGTDYALLITSRYREELRTHDDRHEAMAAALRGAGPAILASAATVSLGLMCLVVSDLASDRGLGPVAAVGILSVLAVMLTLYPALLVIAGRWVFWPKVPRNGDADPDASGIWHRIGQRIAMRPRPVWIAVALILAALAALNLAFLKPSGLDNTETFTKQLTAVTADQVLDRHFPAGATQPTIIVVSPYDQSAAKAAFDIAKDTPGVAGPMAKPQEADDYILLAFALKDPPDSEAARQTVVELRERLAANPDIDTLVGGQTAVNLDTETATVHDRTVVIPLVLLAICLIISVLLRALVAPLLLTIVGLLSFTAALGISVTLFNVVLGQEHQDPSYPLYSFIFLVALGVDYNIFLMHRVREETLRASTRQSILTGLSTTGGVITSAGLVLAATFTALAVLPITATVQLGLTVAIGVLLDTFVVRTILFPALALDVDQRLWWPSKR